MIVQISPSKLYRKAALIIGHNTPLSADCGALCGGACCEETDEVTGMYLFPRERERYKALPHWAKIYDTDFEYSKDYSADLFTCGGKCERSLRPLACMIFPLVPYARRGEKMRVIMDPRGMGMCPLAVMKISDLEPKFVSAVYSAMKLLMLNSECREFIYSLSEELDCMAF